MYVEIRDKIVHWQLQVDLVEHLWMLRENQDWVLILELFELLYKVIDFCVLITMKLICVFKTIQYHYIYLDKNIIVL
jgi:hypothetical protein